MLAYLKSQSIYALIAVFVVGGVYGVSVKIASAAVLWDSSDVGASPATFTYNGANGFTSNTGTNFINSGTIGGFWINLISSSNHCGSSCNDLDIETLETSSGHGSRLVITNTVTSNKGWIFVPADVISGGGVVTSGQQVQFIVSGASSNWVVEGSATRPRIIVVENEHDASPSNFANTRFIDIYPENGTTTATTSPLGAKIYANGNDFLTTGDGYGRLHIHAHQPSLFACENSGAVFDAVNTCAGSNAPASDFDYDYGTTTATRITSGQFDFKDFYTFLGGGKWQIEYDIQQVSTPWYFFGLSHNYTTLVSTTTTIIVGQPSPMDLIQESVASSTNAINVLTQQGIGSILASTTASLKSACNIISGGFSIGDCLTLLVWPGSSAIEDDFLIVKELPPWGYVFRLVDILNATTSTTTLPTIAYDFASTSPMASIGTIHFDPFGAIQQSGTLINEMVSDRSDPKNVWQILMPVVNIFVYLVLGFMVFHDLTGIHKHDDGKKYRDRNEK